MFTVEQCKKYWCRLILFRHLEFVSWFCLFVCLLVVVLGLGFLTVCLVCVLVNEGACVKLYMFLCVYYGR